MPLEAIFQIWNVLLEPEDSSKTSSFGYTIVSAATFSDQGLDLFETQQSNWCTFCFAMLCGIEEACIQHGLFMIGGGAAWCVNKDGLFAPFVTITLVLEFLEAGSHSL